MARYATAYVATLVLFLGIDAIWLTTMSQRLYRPYLAEVLATNVNVVPAVLFYLVYVAGILVFDKAPAFSTGRWQTAAVSGALFGFFAYATYDLTNHATIKGWPAIITVADIVWGSALSATAGALGFVITRYFFPGD